MNTTTTERKTTAEVQLDGRDAHNIPAGDLMNTTQATRRNAAAATRTICSRIKTEARTQGLTFGGLRKKTGLNPRAVLRVWLGHDPSIWAIERSREVLGLTIEQVWKVR